MDRKVLMLSIGYGELGGVGTVTKELTEALNARGDHQVEVLTFWPWHNNNGHKRFSFIDAGGERKDYSTLEDFLTSEEGERTDYDIIHLHSHIFADSYLRMAGSSVTTSDFLNRYSAPKVFLTHCLTPKTEGIVPNPTEIDAQKQIMNLSDIIVHLTAEQEEEAGKCYPEFKDKTAVIGNGVKVLPNFDGVNLLREQLAPSGEWLGLYLGRLSKEKGIEELVEAMPTIKSECPNFKLVIVGNTNSHYDLSIRHKLSELGFKEGKDYELLDWTGDEQLKARLIQAADFMLLPSYYEHFPMAALEGMAAGTPVIISNTKNVQNLFYLNDPLRRVALPIARTADPTAISEAVLYALNHEFEMRQISGRALARVCSTHNIERVAGEYAQLYSELGAGKNGGNEEVPTVSRISSKIGVVIPTYNRRETVMGTIDSFLAQNYAGDYKIIVVDDGSIDGTLEALKEKYSSEIDYVEDTITNRKESMRGKEGRIIVVRQRNKHVSAARNKGLEVAYELGCNLFTIQDAGDRALPNKLNDLGDFLKDNPEVDLVHAKSRDVDEKGNPLSEGYEKYYQPFWEKAARGELKRGDLESWSYIHNQTILFNRKVIDTLGRSNLYWEKLKYGEDYDFFLKAERAGLTLSFCDSYVAETVNHREGLTFLSKYQEISPAEIASLAAQAVNASEKREFYKNAVGKGWNGSEADSSQFQDYFGVVFGLRFEREFYLRLGDLGRAITLADEIIKLQPTKENREILDVLTWRCL